MTQSDWRDFPALQQPNYPDQEQLQAAVARLRALPPLVTSWEIESRSRLNWQKPPAASGSSCRVGTVQSRLTNAPLIPLLAN